MLYPSYCRQAALLLLFFAAFPYTVFAQGNLLLTPRRIVFEHNVKNAEINIANVGADTAKYAVSFMEQRMKEDGSFESITVPDSGQFFASKYLRYYPRNIYLGPNESQVVRFQLRNFDQLQPGEYRSHLYFRAIQEEKPLGEAPPASNKKDISVQLKAVFGISIPVIIRIGESTTEVTIDSIQVVKHDDTTNHISFYFLRKGNFSTYGDLTVDHISNTGKTTRLCTAKGLAVYVPNHKRKLKVLVDRNSKVDLKKGKLLVLYTDNVNTETIIARKEIQLP